jgi:hypothetical protein
LKEDWANHISVRNLADTTYGGFTALEFFCINKYWISKSKAFAPTTMAVDHNYYLQSGDGVALQNAIELVAGRADIPRLGDVTVLTGKHIIPQTAQGSSLGDLTHEFDAAYLERLVFHDDDFFNYDETNNRFRFYIGNVCRGYIDATGWHDGAP